MVVVRSLSAKFQGLSPSLLNLKDGTITNIDLSNQSMWEAEVSPDNSTLAYTWFNYEASEWELVLTNSNNSNHKVIWTSKNSFGIYSWVNNQQIFLFNGEYIIFDIYKNTENKVITSDFPEFDISEYMQHFFISVDPSISKVIYKSEDVNILDLTTNTIIGKIRDSYDRGIITAWSPSGKQAAVVSANSEDIKNIASDEIFIVDQNGRIKQLTNLLESYNSGKTIESLSWSPDEKKIAFWRHDGNGNLTLMIVDVNDGQVKSSCISSLTQHHFPIYLPAPIWLSDSIHLIIESRYEQGKSKLLIMNVSENIAFPIAENFNPVGWIKDN